MLLGMRHQNPAFRIDWCTWWYTPSLRFSDATSNAKKQKSRMDSGFLGMSRRYATA